MLQRADLNITDESFDLIYKEITAILYCEFDLEHSFESTFDFLIDEVVDIAITSRDESQHEKQTLEWLAKMKVDLESFKENAKQLAEICGYDDELKEYPYYLCYAVMHLAKDDLDVFYENTKREALQEMYDDEENMAWLRRTSIFI